MARVLLPFLILALNAYAQTPEPPTEKASVVTVVIFLVIFIGSCAGYLGWVLWSARKKQDEKK